MKKTLLFAFAALSVMAHAQSFIESFDTGPTGWVDTTVTNFGNAAGGQSMAFASGTWHALNNSSPLGLSGWFSNNLTTAPFGPHSGAGLANANFQNGAGLATIDNYMMSPVRTFNNGDQISFWTRTVDAPGFPDRLILKLSTAGASTSVASFTTTLLTVNPSLTTAGYPNTWTFFTTTITGLGGPTSGRFAFNYNVPSGGPNGANSDYIGIDDVRYSAVPEPGSMIALGLGAAALVARRRRNKKA